MIATSIKYFIKGFPKSPQNNVYFADDQLIQSDIGSEHPILNNYIFSLEVNGYNDREALLDIMNDRAVHRFLLNQKDMAALSDVAEFNDKFIAGNRIKVIDRGVLIFREKKWVLIKKMVLETEYHEEISVVDELLKYIKDGELLRDFGASFNSLQGAIGKQLNEQLAILNFINDELMNLSSSSEVKGLNGQIKTLLEKMDGNYLERDFEEIKNELETIMHKWQEEADKVIRVKGLIPWMTKKWNDSNTPKE